MRSWYVKRAFHGLEGQHPNSGLRPWQRKGVYVDLCPPPPPIGPSELIQLWMRLPAPNRQRLLWLLSQLLEHQLSAAAAQEEDSDESAPRY
jgi:hypothetical protein